jgi:signal transduction histidine kinase
MNNIYFKNFITTAGLVLISFLIIGVAFVSLGRSFVINDRYDSMTRNAEEASKSAAAYIQGGGLNGWDLRMTISSIAQSTGNHIFITNTDGVIISCSDLDIVCDHIGQSVDSTDMNTLANSGSLSKVTTLGGIYSSAHFVVAEPIYVFDEYLAGYVFVSSNSATIVGVWKSFVVIYLTVAFAVLSLALFFSFIASMRQARPLKQMAQAAHSFARGDFSTRIEDDGRQDEIGELTVAFNQMADALETSEQRRSEFIANISHELKTPMTTIAGFADGILDGTIPPEKQDKYLATISAETKRLSRLVRGMLNISKMQSESPEVLKQNSFDVNELILRTLLNFEGKINDKQLDVDAQLPEESMMVAGNADSITQVVYNLLDNAIKFAPVGSVIGISLWKQDGKAYVAVKNSGETIPEDELARIFDRFHKTDKSRSQDRDGVGLGLYIVKTILNNHDENITVRSKDGVTEFVFTLTLKS